MRSGLFVRSIRSSARGWEGAGSGSSRLRTVAWHHPIACAFSNVQSARSERAKMARSALRMVSARQRAKRSPTGARVMSRARRSGSIAFTNVQPWESTRAAIVSGGESRPSVGSTIIARTGSAASRSVARRALASSLSRATGWAWMTLCPRA